MAKWGVWCTVSGGVTGSRGSWLKANGDRVEFETETEAKAEAATCRSSISPFGVARFGYYASPLEDAVR